MNTESFFNRLKPFWASFALIFYIVLANALRRSFGFLRLKHLIFLTFGMLLFFLFHRAKNLETKFSWKRWTCCIWFLFSIFLVVKPGLFYPEVTMFFHTIQVMLYLNVLISISFLLSSFGKWDLINIQNPVGRSLGIMAVFLIFSTYVITLVASPEPAIDVFYLQHMGANYFLEGKNPYLIKYPDFHQGRYDSTFGYLYWPIVLYWTAPLKMLFGDVRFALVISLLLTVIGYRKLAGDLTRFFYGIMIWLAFPVGLFVIEQAWIDGLILAPFIWGLYFFKSEKFFKGAILFGLVAATKQYMIFMFPLVFFYLLARKDLRIALQGTFIAVFSCLLTMLPFLIASPHEFLQETFFKVLSLSPRDDSLSWNSYLFKFYGIVLSSKVTLPIYAVAIGIGSWVIYQGKRLKDLLFAVVFIYGIVFLFGKQAFCNYYYLLSFFLFLYITETVISDQNEVELK